MLGKLKKRWGDNPRDTIIATDPAEAKEQGHKKFTLVPPTRFAYLEEEGYFRVTSITGDEDLAAIAALSGTPDDDAVTKEEGDADGR
jgi:hypothetical protein